MYKAQACKYKKDPYAPVTLEDVLWRDGIAILKIYNYANVLHIIDCVNGQIVGPDELLDYKLVDGPLAFCDPGYKG